MTQLKGVTPEIADQIIKGQPYKSVDDALKNIPKETLEKLEIEICFPISPRTLYLIRDERIDKKRDEKRSEALSEKAAEAPVK